MPQQRSAKSKRVPPASGRILRAGAGFFQSRNNKWWVICFWWQLTYDITVHIIRLSLKEGCFEISVAKPIFHWLSFSNSPEILVLWMLGILSSSNLFVFLRNLAMPIQSFPGEVALFVGLDGEKPSSCEVLRFELPHVNEVNNLIVNPGFALEVFCFSKLLAATPLCGVTLLWDFFFWLPQVAIQSSMSGLIVNSVWELNSCPAGIIDHFFEAQ